MNPTRKFCTSFAQGCNRTRRAQSILKQSLCRTITTSPYYKQQMKQSETQLEAELQFKGSNFDFPCLNKRFEEGPEPSYQKVVDGYKLFHHDEPFHFLYNDCVIPELKIAYETWGKLNEDRDNAVLIFTGLSASSHAKSHEENPSSGWWEKFIGPGLALDTNKFFVICTNQLGGCYGTTGPSSINPATDKRYGSNFPMISVKDMVESNILLLDAFGITKLHAAVGSSLGGMCSLAYAALYPDRLKRMVSISACAQSRPTSIALRYLQRRCIMEDKNWNEGHYYDGEYPLHGMKLAREIATLTYRSGPEWEQRFGRALLPNAEVSLCPTFEIEQYVEYQGLAFSTKFDPNSLLYISKAMDLFDLNDYFPQDSPGLSHVCCPSLVMGASTDLLFPVWQQRELANKLTEAGNNAVTYYELNSIYGHDTFLLDVNSVGTAVKGFLETDMKPPSQI
ncbi:uncharacterized protein LOC120326722 [Styela clava]